MMTLLVGHTSFETAAIATDYPYGRLRTEMRFWIERATKGAGKGQERMVTCSLNPKTDKYNKPHAGVYSDRLYMYKDDKGHIHNTGIGVNSMREQFSRIVACGLYDQMPEDMKKEFDAILKIHNKYNPTTNKRYEEQVEMVKQAIKEHGYRDDLYSVAGFESGSDKYIYEKTFAVIYAEIKAIETKQYTEVPY